MNRAISQRDTCVGFLGQLDSHLAGELSAEATMEIRDHLARCPACAAEDQARQRIRRQLKTAASLETVPADLRGKVHERLLQQVTLKQSGSGWMWYALAAASLVIGVGIWISLRLANSPGEWSPAAQVAYVRELSVNLNGPLPIGLGDHVHCAVLRKYPTNPPTFQEMAQALGAEYGGLVDVIERKTPPGYRVVLAHRCRFQERRFVHVVMRNQSVLISLVITRKMPGDATFAGKLIPALTEVGVPIYQESTRGFQVAGFESKDHSVFVVSNEDAKANLTLSAALAPAVSDLLGRIEG